MMRYQKFAPEGWNNKEPMLTEQDFKRAIQNGEILEGYVTKCDSDYNLYINCFDGTTGIIPRTEIEAINVDDTGVPKPNICMNKVNRLIQFKVKEIDNENKFILSRKEAGIQALEWMMNDLQEGMIVDGIVRSIQHYGVFVEIGGGIVGLLHIEDISVARIKNPAERLKIGQKIKVMVKSIDRELKRIVLTYKELLGTWEQNVKSFNEGDIVTGIVRETDKLRKGIFIELKPNLVGMAEYREDLEYGKNILVSIKKIIPEKKKIKLVIL